MSFPLQNHRYFLQQGNNSDYWKHKNSYRSRKMKTTPTQFTARSVVWRKWALRETLFGKGNLFWPIICLKSSLIELGTIGFK
jgi:hypothetical protein